MKKILLQLQKHKHFTGVLFFLNFLFFLGLYIDYWLIGKINNNFFILQEAIQLSPVTKVGIVIILGIFYFLLPLLLYTVVKYFIVERVVLFHKKKFTVDFMQFFSLNLKVWLFFLFLLTIFNIIASGLEPSRGFLIFFITYHVVLFISFYLLLNYAQLRLLHSQEHAFKKGLRLVFQVKKYWKLLFVNFIFLLIPMAIMTLLGYLFKLLYVQKFGLSLTGNTVYVNIYYGVFFIALFFVLSFNQVYFFQRTFK